MASRSTGAPPPSASGDTRTTRAPEADPRFGVPLRGIEVDAESRCEHWHGPTDVVAMRCACCEVYYPCAECHEAATGRPFVPWPLARADEPAVLCGVCCTSMTPEAHLGSGDACPACGAAFNPGCHRHRHLYFEA
ncbi:MAG: CHY zinc finger protein [Bacteroidota bacterium]